MSTSLPQHSPQGARSVRHRRPASRRWALAAFCVPAVATALTLLLPRPLILPALSVLMLAAGFGLALADHVMPRPDRGARDLAGALVFFGFAASLLADPEQVLAAFAELDASFGGSPSAPE